MVKQLSKWTWNFQSYLEKMRQKDLNKGKIQFQIITINYMKYRKKEMMSFQIFMERMF